MRLDKLLSNLAFGSRKEVKGLIATGLVTVNREVVTSPMTQVDPEKDQILLGDQAINYSEWVYLMLHKPMDCITATEDAFHQTVMDCIGDDHYRKDLFPVGRLDRDTTGLLLITNNGQMAHQLLSPKHKVPKIYYATVDGVVDESTVEQFAKGLDLGDFTALPSQLWIDAVNEDDQLSQVHLEIYEGKFHQVKRMFEACGMNVLQLHRHSMGPLIMDPDLEPGQYRPLTSEEKELLKPFGCL